jgi:acyl-CoA reductase-like NAD-dependent aldehyde dehydrogenase
MIFNSDLEVVYELNIMKKTERLSKLLEVGIVTLDNVVISDPRSHSGGVKNSGFGRVIKKWNARIS